MEVSACHKEKRLFRKVEEATVKAGWLAGKGLSEVDTTSLRESTRHHHLFGVEEPTLMRHCHGFNIPSVMISWHRQFPIHLMIDPFSYAKPKGLIRLGSGNANRKCAVLKC